MRSKRERVGLSTIARIFVKILILAVATASVGSCTTVPYQVRTGTVRTPTLGQMESLDMDRAAPVLIRIYKEERTLEVWKQDRTGKFALLKSYPICKYSGKLGPKITQVITKRLRDFMTSLQIK